MSQWGLSESVLPLHSCTVKNSSHCFPGWTWLQMSGEPDSCSAQALLAGRPPLPGLPLAGWRNVNGCSYSSLAWKLPKRTENCWPGLPPSSKTLGPFQLGLTGKVDKLQRELNAESLALIFKLATSGLTGGWFHSPNEPSTMNVALKRKKKKKQFLEDAFSKGPHVYSSWKILVFMF